MRHSLLLKILEQGGNQESIINAGENFRCPVSLKDVLWETGWVIRRYANMFQWYWIYKKDLAAHAIFKITWRLQMFGIMKTIYKTINYIAAKPSFISKFRYKFPFLDSVMFLAYNIFSNSQHNLSKLSETICGC
ncbi:MAG: hypothetical protein WCA04_00660 [Geobacteraceae bacterium]